MELSDEEKRIIEEYLDSIPDSVCFALATTPTHFMKIVRGFMTKEQMLSMRDELEEWGNSEQVTIIDSILYERN